MPKLSGDAGSHKSEIAVFKSRLREAVIDAQDAANCRRRWEAIRRAQRAFEGAMAAAYSAMADDPSIPNIDIDIADWPATRELRKLRHDFTKVCTRSW